MEKNAPYARVLEAARKHGLKLTTRRLQVITVLVKARRPLSADEIHDKIAAEVDRVTVYRTLSALERADCLSRFTFQNKHTYELVTAHHHYLMCRGCEKTERIPSCTLADIESVSLKFSKKFRSVDHHTLQLSGLCKSCS